jgi:hypothetical protein
MKRNGSLIVSQASPTREGESVQKPTTVFLIGLVVCCVICGALFVKIFGSPIYPLVTFVAAIALAGASFEFLHKKNSNSLMAQGHLVPFGARQGIWWGGFVLGLVWFYFARSF